MERADALLFAPTQEALTLYYKMLSNKGKISSNRYYRFSQNNAASSNILDFTFYNTGTSAKSFFSKAGQQSFIGRDLAIFSANCTDVTNEYASVNIYILMQTKEQ